MDMRGDPPDNVSCLIISGDMLHPGVISEVQHWSHRLLSFLLRPILVRLPLVLLHQLGDHHDHRHLLLDHHPPELLEGGRLGSRGSKELLGATWRWYNRSISCGCINLEVNIVFLVN